jgi:hypothetical protein
MEERASRVAFGRNRYYYYHVAVPLGDERGALLEDCRAMAQASKAQERIRDNDFLR